MPNLTIAALQDRLGRRTVSPVHVLVGADAKLIDRLVDAFEDTIDEADRPFAVERVYAGEAGGSPVDIAAAARVFPMLGDRRLVIVLRAERFLKPRRGTKGTSSDAEASGDEGASDPADLGPLEDYLESPMPSTCLLLVASDIDRTRRFSKRLQAAADVTRCDGFDTSSASARREARASAISWVQEELERSDRVIDPAAVQLLVDRAGGDITRLRSDVERLVLYTEGQRRVSHADVAETVSTDVTVEDEWAVVNAMASGDVAQALREVGRRMERGDSPHALVGQLRWWVSARLAEADPHRVRPAVEALLRTDLALKSSGGDARVLIERLVVELTGRPLPQRGWRR